MAAHTTDPGTESTSGGALLPVFATAVVVATIAICLVIAVPSIVTLVIALATVIGFAAAIVAVLGRIIGPVDH